MSESDYNTSTSLTSSDDLCISKKHNSSAVSPADYQHMMLFSNLSIDEMDCKEESSSRHCPKCSKVDNQVKLQLYQINFDEAIYICPQKNCQYPLLNGNLESFLVQCNVSSGGILQNDEHQKLSGILVNHKTTDGGDSLSRFEEHSENVGLINMNKSSLQIPDKCLVTTFEENPSNLIYAEQSKKEENLSTLQFNEQDLSILLSPPRNDVMLQWQNGNSLCWLNVLLHCIVNSTMIRSALNCNMNVSERKNYVFHRLCNIYDNTQGEYQQHLTDREYLHESSLPYETSNVLSKLSLYRQYIFKILQLKFSLIEGTHESALEMFPNLVKLDPVVESLFSSHVRWDFECEVCHHRRARRVVGDVISFPSTSSYFHPLNANFTRSCFNCSAENQTMNMSLEMVPPCLMMHFQQGLPHNHFQVLDFGMQGNLYAVSAVIQYITHPFNHFVTWIRDCKTNRWFCCDDLKGATCKWNTTPPKILPKQIHMVMWEKQGLDSPIIPTYTNDKSQSHIQSVKNEAALLEGDQIPPELYATPENIETIVVDTDTTSIEKTEVEVYHCPTKVPPVEKSSLLSTEETVFDMDEKIDSEFDLSDSLYADLYLSDESSSDVSITDTSSLDGSYSSSDNASNLCPDELLPSAQSKLVVTDVRSLNEDSDLHHSNTSAAGCEQQRERDKNQSENSVISALTTVIPALTKSHNLNESELNRLCAKNVHTVASMAMKAVFPNPPSWLKPPLCPRIVLQDCMNDVSLLQVSSTRGTFKFTETNQSEVNEENSITVFNDSKSHDINLMDASPSYPASNDYKLDNNVHASNTDVSNVNIVSSSDEIMNFPLPSVSAAENELSDIEISSLSDPHISSSSLSDDQTSSSDTTSVIANVAQHINDDPTDLNIQASPSHDDRITTCCSSDSSTTDADKETAKIQRRKLSKTKKTFRSRRLVSPDLCSSSDSELDETFTAKDSLGKKKLLPINKQFKIPTEWLKPLFSPVVVLEDIMKINLLKHGQVKPALPPNYSNDEASKPILKPVSSQESNPGSLLKKSGRISKDSGISIPLSDCFLDSEMEISTAKDVPCITKLFSISKQDGKMKDDYIDTSDSTVHCDSDINIPPCNNNHNCKENMTSLHHQACANKTTDEQHKGSKSRKIERPSANNINNESEDDKRSRHVSSFLQPPRYKHKATIIHEFDQNKRLTQTSNNSVACSSTDAWDRNDDEMGDNDSVRGDDDFIPYRQNRLTLSDLSELNLGEIIEKFPASKPEKSVSDPQKLGTEEKNIKRPVLPLQILDTGIDLRWNSKTFVARHFQLKEKPTNLPRLSKPHELAGSYHKVSQCPQDFDQGSQMKETSFLKRKRLPSPTLIKGKKPCNIFDGILPESDEESLGESEIDEWLPTKKKKFESDKLHCKKNLGYTTEPVNFSELTATLGRPSKKIWSFENEFDSYEPKPKSEVKRINSTTSVDSLNNTHLQQTTRLVSTDAYSDIVCRLGCDFDSGISDCSSVKSATSNLQSIASNTDTSVSISTACSSNDVSSEKFTLHSNSNSSYSNIKNNVDLELDDLINDLDLEFLPILPF